MKIALLAPSSVPFVVGGAENLYWGLQSYINEQTRHQCELIKVPSLEGDFSEIIQAYRKFSMLDFNHFDMLISTKYPSWMTYHKNHVCYMLHTLRGLYDTYHFMNEPEDFNWEEAGLSDLQYCMQQALLAPENGNSQLSDFFDRLSRVQDKIDDKSLFRFPGPFIRQIVHFLDSYGLATQRVCRHAAISKTVANRLDYFPTNANVSVLYPPPRLSEFYCGSDDYLFTVSRLDSPKRIDLLIEAMRHVKADIPLLIGGVGPELERLRSLAGDDQRIRFLGHLTNKEIIDHYAHSLAVLFVPYDEDYGYITIEAMKSKKPVITVTDAGGPNEFVINGETGFSVKPDAPAIAESIEYLCANRQKACEMGINASKRVAPINWETVVNGLLGDQIQNKIFSMPTNTKIIDLPKRKKIVVAVSFPIYPPRGGGQSRVYHLYRNLAKFIDVEIVSFCGVGEPVFRQEISPGLTETRIPKSSDHQDIENKFSETVNWVPVTDIVMSNAFTASSVYVEALRTACEGANAVIASHPFLINAIKTVAPNLQLWFEAHNVEYELKKRILPHNENAEILLEMVKSDEGLCWRDAKVVFACTNEDIFTLERIYGTTSAVKNEVVNGVSLEDVKYLGIKERSYLKLKLGLGKSKLAIFMGSWHGPNLEAVEKIFEYALAFPDVKFAIIGSAGLAFNNVSIPSNVFMVGVVDDEEKNILLGAADIALNPMMSGSGSNLKMLDYFAAGVPVISTPFGARGIEAQPGTHYIAAEVDGFILELSLFFSDPKRYESVSQEGRKLVESYYNWDGIAHRFYQSLQVSNVI
ncbi:glycosyltransferase family 4 protein [Nitrosomonas communis]|uniref:Glycosyltransferase involved in cell wall bisynthesis n=1 Tax=Nitrosomonas communis TaxID=44574 RepID=A0A1I4MRG0_9PROT|nr:glycosyltransferase family 4 protein [Nitrosomonas communis]SFM05911.1 Glycosyltransferase involved in cell wall bisynthesis [Nitrosomonas communis]